jgi:Sec-independent protein translocase protein TatA
MNSVQDSSDLKRFIRKFKYKWADLWNEFIKSLAEEEMRLQREERTKQAGARIGSRNPWDQQGDKEMGMRDCVRK